MRMSSFVFNRKAQEPGCSAFCMLLYRHTRASVATRALRLAAAALVSVSCAVVPVNAQESGILGAMRTELDRSMAVLRTQEVPPYFLSYEITEIESRIAQASFGSLTNSGENRQRLLDIDLRVGDYELDNTRQVRGAGGSFFGFNFPIPVKVPVEDDANAIRAVLWAQTDRKYKQALERFTTVQTNVVVKVEAEDQSADFSREQPSSAVEAVRPIEADLAYWGQKVERYSAPFAQHGVFYQAQASISANTETRWFVNSEGSQVQTSETVYRLAIAANTKADDGMVLPLYRTYFAFTPDGLPDDETVRRDVEKMIATLLALREAPLVEPYTGPAILAGRASGVFFHEILGHRLEGHRQKSENEGQTFKKQLGERVLPENFSVHFDPTASDRAGTDLAGAYRFDNQGIEARRVPVIEGGVLKNFLMSRAPIEGFSNSNGHGRKQAGFAPVSRQSNLIVEVSDPLTSGELKARLLADIADKGKRFGLRFADIQGGFTTTGRFMPNAFNVTPLVVYRVYPDGSEELVRGVDLIGTPLTTLSRIVAGDDQIAVFNGTCGAESGGVPVSASSPSILVSQIEVQKKGKSQDRPPLLPAPLDSVDRG